MPLKIPAVDIDRLQPPPPPIERDKYDFAPPIPITAEDDMRAAIRRMSFWQVRNVVEAIENRPVSSLHVERLATRMRMWAGVENDK